MTAARAELGERLFYDDRLSGDTSPACASRPPDKAFTERQPPSDAHAGAAHFRNTPALANVGRRAAWLHDGRLGTNLNDVAREMITETCLMNMDMRIMHERLKQDPVHAAMFKAAGMKEPSNGGARNALMDFMKTIVSRGAPIEGGELSASAERGRLMFDGKAAGHSGPRFTDDKPHNTGVPGNSDIRADPERISVFVTYAKFMGAENYMNLREDLVADMRDHRPETARSVLPPRPRGSVGGCRRRAALGPPPIPADTPMTPEKIALGEKLFFDPILSGNCAMPCSACHLPEAGWAVQAPISFGHPGTTHWRNSRTIINSADCGTLFWAGSSGSLEGQAPSAARGGVAGNGEDDMMEARHAYMAIAANQRTPVQTDTPCDACMNGDDDALSDAQKRGLDPVAGKAGGVSCHNGPLLSDEKYCNLGVPPFDGWNDDEIAQITVRFKICSKASTEKMHCHVKDGPGLYFRTKQKSDQGKLRPPNLTCRKCTRRPWRAIEKESGDACAAIPGSSPPSTARTRKPPRQAPAHAR